MKPTGSIMISLIITTSLFLTVIYVLLLALSTQFDFTFRQHALDQSLNIAEAGIDYYRWHLAHAPEDFTSDQGEHEYRDPQGDLIGYYDLQVTPPDPGSSTVTIRSTGWTTSFPQIKRTIVAQYGQTSLASYAYFSDAVLWFGSGTTVNGQVHSNNGIRMDGTNTSTFTSAKTTYTCGVESGCWPDSEEKPGIWGKGGPEELWSFPVPAVDFNSIKLDFASMRQSAQDSGIYLAPSGAAGYHLVFNASGTVSVYTVTAVSSKRGYTPEDGCQNLYQIIDDQDLIGTYPLTNIDVIFAEDTLWVDGTVKGKVMVAAARFPLGTFATNIWIPNNLVYASQDGTNNLGLVAQNDIYFSLEVPRDFIVNAAMVAQDGKIVRHHYNYHDCSHYSQAQRSSITTYGTIISRGQSYWNFGSGPGEPTSGFVKRYITYDQTLPVSPPPYFPVTTQVDLISWREE